MTSTTNTWILVSVPSAGSGRGDAAPLSERVATRAALVLLGWAERRRDRIHRSVRLDRVDRAVTGQRPFC